MSRCSPGWAGDEPFGGDDPLEPVEEPTEAFVGRDEPRSVALGDGRVEEVVDRMRVVPAGEVPGALQVARVVDQTDGEPEEELPARVRGRTGPAPAADPHEEGIPDLLEEKPRSEDGFIGLGEAMEDGERWQGRVDGRRDPVDHDTGVNDGHPSLRSRAANDPQ